MPRIYKQIHTQPKVCEICEKVFERPKRVGLGDWERRVACNINCYWIWKRKHQIGFKKGHPGYENSGSFKKGQKSWNKGLHISFNDALKRYQQSPNYINPNKGKKFSEEFREKIRIARAKQTNIPSGENHWNWKGGATELRKKLQNTSLYRNWRSTVFQRDDYTCQKCLKRGGTLNADHITPYSRIISENNITTVEQAKKCTELWNISNGLTLCIQCHQKTDTYGSKSINRSF